MTSENLLATLRDLATEVDEDVERFALDRAYMVAGGPLLAVATRLGWPQADVFLSFVLAVRALAHVNKGGTLTFDEAKANYEQQRAIITRWLDSTPVED